MPAVFENIIDLVGGLIAQEKKKKKKLRVVPAKYPSSAIMAIKPRIRARPVFHAYVAPLEPFVAPFAELRLTKKGLPPQKRGPKLRKELVAEDDARLASALASAELEASSRRRGARRESGTESEASSRRGRPRKAVAVGTASEREGERSTGTEKPRRRKAKAEETKEELSPATIFPEEYAALRAPTRDFTPGKESGLKKDGTPSLSSTKGRELAASVAAGEIPPFIPIRASPLASAKRVSEKPPPASKPKLKVVPALKKKEAADLERLFFEGLEPVRAEAKAKAKKSSPRETIVEAPGFPPAIGSGLRRRRRVRMH